MLKSKSQNSICEEEARFIQERITAVEKHFAELCTSFAAYARKSARLRDKNDEVAKVIQTYAESETINISLSRGLSNFAATLSVIGDYKDAEVQRIDSKIISILSHYSIICRHAREDVKNTFSARDKELARRKHIDKLRLKESGKSPTVSQADLKSMTATVQVLKVVKGLEEQIDSFEKRKLHDLKTLLLDFVMIELSFHTKAVELFTKAYQDIAEIDVFKDLEKFREMLNVPETFSRFDTVTRTSFRQSYSLNNLPNHLSSSPVQLKNLSRTTESLDSLKTAVTNSSELVQVDEYDESSNTTGETIH
ncbi:CBY1-interacting BAR domain-containing protein 1-A isoform X1 [Microplitis mediator]|uniref:CBY1-interacting BAR domain-containing protein 1-A isoform X1 n=1 Tax=Microplitis mediator TaxID=375433 RepID=UPI0025577434|nr:CBY1-interacting BAR domain-containing protein 1-A isoform X1 [Microplitis mediator]